MVPKPPCVPGPFHTVITLPDEDAYLQFHTHYCHVKQQKNVEGDNLREQGQIFQLTCHLLFPISASVLFLFIQNLKKKNNCLSRALRSCGQRTCQHLFVRLHETVPLHFLPVLTMAFFLMTKPSFRIQFKSMVYFNYISRHTIPI